MMLFIIATQHKEKKPAKKIPRVMKEELLASIIEIEDKDEPELEEAVKIVRDQNKDKTRR